MKLKNILLFSSVTSVLLFSDIYHEANITNMTGKHYSEQSWGIGAVIRSASIPYSTEDDVVSTFVPMLFFENEYIFLHGLESGLKLYESDEWRFSAISRVRYIDIPQKYQNILQVDGNDMGLQARYKMENRQFIDLEIMNDLHGRSFSNLRYSANLENGSLEYRPYVQLRLNSSKFNTYYYGLDQEHVSSDLDTSVGIETKYHVISNFYLLARAQATYLGKETRKSTYVKDSMKGEVYLGIGFFNDKSKEKKESLGISPYIRLAHGWATPSNLNDIMGGNTEKDPYNNQLTSLFYGYPLTNEIFGFPLDFYLTPGFIFHHSSEVQDATQEYVLAIKTYYTFQFPWKVRFGLAEGFSYANDVTYIEKSEMESKGYRPSQLLNYLDFSFDVHLGDLFGKTLNGAWLGYSIHHRSAMFESSSHYGRIKGGSNYNCIYLQWHY